MRFTRRVYKDAAEKARAEYHKALDNKPCSECGEPARKAYNERVNKAARSLGLIKGRALREKGIIP